ncbi:thioesterase [Planosporangium thailandense]|uniref:Thioesterase n=1 Tax=Planosporangium thailandense TaxID=765197 RepID=A0ABX0XZS3_9ACTN|nr:thioesterase [Planosporangium thailandense]
MSVGTGGAIVRPLPRPGATATLVCLSFCGGGTAPFRPWTAALPGDVELALVTYPGREGRYTEPFAADWDELMADVVAAVETLKPRPFVLFGHSMGARVAFDLALRLSRHAGPQPSAVVVSAGNPPSDRPGAPHTPPADRATDTELLSWMRGLGQLPDVILTEPDLRRMAVDTCRADLRVLQSYRYAPGARLHQPLYVLCPQDDESMAPQAPHGWAALASGPVHVRTLPGGHFYTSAGWQGLPEHFADVWHRHGPRPAPAYRAGQLRHD